MYVSFLKISGALQSAGYADLYNRPPKEAGRNFLSNLQKKELFRKLLINLLGEIFSLLVGGVFYQYLIPWKGGPLYGWK
jgi:hypothetical protein